MTEYYTGPNNARPLIGIVITLCIVTSLLGIWRFAYRGSKGRLGLSDYLLMVALILALCQAGLNISASTVWGYGYHKLDLPPKIRNSATPKLLFFLSQVFFKVETGCTKLSISVVYMKIFHSALTRTVRISRNVNYALAFVIVTYYTGGSLVSLLQCLPVRKVWHSAIPGTCINLYKFRLANAYINITTSAWLIAMPFPALLTVKRPSKELWQFLGLVALGCIHTASAIWRVVMMYHPNPLSASDPQWASTLSNTVAMVEEFVGIIVATIIVMRPCFDIAAKKFAGAIATILSTTTGKSTTLKSIEKPRTISGTMESWKSKGDRGGFNIMTTEIEMDSPSRSTEEILKGVGHICSREMEGTFREDAVVLC